jgi:dihydroxyacid dehydratase/phosphogluconate dehydratase
VPEAHLRSELNELLGTGRLGGVSSNAECLRRTPEQNHVPGRLGSRQQHQSLGGFRQRLETPQKVLLELTGKIRRAGNCETTGQFGGSHTPWQFQQREGVSPGFSNDTVPNVRIDSTWGCRRQVTSDVWALGPDRIMGRIDDEEWDELEGVFAPTVGVCNVMGTASTMAIATEVLGMALPGSAVVPAVESRRSDLAERTGVRAVELARAGTRPEELMTASAFDNALRVLAATGGSTNEFIHLEAIAGRLGLSLGLDRFAGIGEKTPQVLGVRPSGAFSLEDFDQAGGVPALLAVLEPLLDRDSVLGDGRTVAEISAAVRSAKPRPHPCLRSLEDPFEPQSGLVVLRGSLAPRGAVFKRSAAPRALWAHRGPAVVFDYHTAQARAQDPDLQASPDSVIVLRYAGPVGAPGMPEVDFVPIPAVLRKAGVTELVCVTDGRMSGTEGGATALHVTPEAAVGGPIGLIRDGDEIVLDATTGRLDLLVEDRELARRATEAPPRVSSARRGYERLYLDHVLQADQGCDFDFLVDRA